MGNMFRCTLASGGSLVLTVTCDSEFAGQTITCTDGTTTLTKTCPSSSPYTVEFKIPNAGTWLISSGTSSTSIIIPDTADLHTIPTGSTVTPTDDIQTLLHCANIWDKSYTTVSALLADTTSLLAVVSDNNSADYLVRSTTFASDFCADSTAMAYIGANNYCADTLLADSTWLNAICSSTYFESVFNVKVPTMTSDTTPSGQTSAATLFGSTHAYQSFDGISIGSVAILSGTSGYIQYMFTSPVNIKMVLIQEYNRPSGYTVNSFPKNVTFKVSNDGSSWTDVGSANMSGATQGQIFKHILSYSGNYSYFRMQILSNNGQSGYTQCGNPLQFYGRASS